MGMYVLAYLGGEEPTDELAAQAEMDAWIAWFTGLGDVVADDGNPFGPSATVAPDRTVTPGGGAGLTGYSIVTADSLDAALEIAKGCPHLDAGGTIEVYETFDPMSEQPDVTHP